MTARSRRTSSCSMAPLRYRNRIPGQYGNSFCDKVFRRCDGAHTWRVVRPAALAAWRRDRWAALSWAFLSSPALEAAPGRESQRHQDPPTRRRRPPRRAHTHAGYVLRSPGAVVVEDLAAETRFGSAPLLDVHGVVSGLSVIIHGKERPFGILGAHSARRRAFTSHDVHFLQAAASVLATAI